MDACGVSTKSVLQMAKDPLIGFPSGIPTQFPSRNSSFPSGITLSFPPSKLFFEFSTWVHDFEANESNTHTLPIEGYGNVIHPTTIPDGQKNASDVHNRTTTTFSQLLSLIFGDFRRKIWIANGRTDRPFYRNAMTRLTQIETYVRVYHCHFMFVFFFSFRLWR